MSSTYNGCYSIPKILAARPDLNDGQKLLLTIIASESTPERPADHSHAQLAKRLAVHRTTVSRWLDALVGFGYLMVVPARLPIPRDRSRTRYHLPVRIWRLFLRGWAMMGGKFRGMRKAVLDWIERQLPLSLLTGTEGKSRAADGPSSFHYKTVLPKRLVREVPPAPGLEAQLSFVGLLAEDPLRSVQDAFDRGLKFFSPERQAQVLAQVAGQP
jgi:DNA-binding MarR family transcriptional regulator